MRIAVTAIFLQKSTLEGFGHYAHELLARMVAANQQDEFLFLYDRPVEEQLIIGPNIASIVVTPKANQPASFKYWYDIKAPLALKKFKPDVWLQPFGYCSLSTSIPQILFVHDLAYQHYPKMIPWYHLLYYRLFTQKMLRKAAILVTVSSFSKKDMVEHFPQIDPLKINIVPGAARTIFQPLSWQEKQAVKDGFADGREYFLFIGGVHPRKNLMHLLKAFSLFKKWQHSNMKLLITGRLAWQYAALTEKLKTYKYRNDIVMLGYVPDEQLAKITASAYAVIYPSFFEGFGLPIIEAMQCGVPVICSQTSAMPETGGDAAQYIDPADPESIAKAMLQIYKDESLRSNLIAAGGEQAAKFSWQRSALSINEIVQHFKP
jgi:glycosyltransferase involved in cell wall biosynthesis